LPYGTLSCQGAQMDITELIELVSIVAHTMRPDYLSYV
jgi:hypothetical protein